jgi:hypothetical protein
MSSGHFPTGSKEWKIRPDGPSTRREVVQRRRAKLLHRVAVSARRIASTRATTGSLPKNCSKRRRLAAWIGCDDTIASQKILRLSLTFG